MEMIRHFVSSGRELVLFSLCAASTLYRKAQQSSRIEVGTVQDFNETDGSNNTQSVDDLTLPTRVSVNL